VLLTFSGYNASGKTTAIRTFHARLEAQGVRSRIVRFFSLDPSVRLRPRPPVPGRTDTVGVPSVRASERQPGRVAKPFRWVHLAKMAVMAAQVAWMRSVHRDEVLLCSQYFPDNLVHFVPRGIWYRLAVWLTPRPTAAFLLIVDMDEYERRFIERLRQRHGAHVERLPDADRDDIQQVLRRYDDIGREYPYLRKVRSSSSADLEDLWGQVQTLVTPGAAPRTASVEPQVR
jgi:thymidylate kinase